MSQKRRRSCLKDVADLASTSVATASRALNRSGYIAPETLERVLKAANELNYQPNLQARGLRQKSSRMIGLLIPNMQNAYYMALADTLSQLMTGYGYHLLVFSSRDIPEHEKAMLHDLAGRSIDGLFWVPSSPDLELVQYLNDQQIPTISIVRRVQDDRLDTIVFEDLLGSQKAVEHLINFGHRNIAFIGGDIRHSSNRDRLEGFLKALNENNIPVHDSMIKIGQARSDWGEQAIRELLDLPQKPTAAFIASNALMGGILRQINHFNIKLPEDLSIICFDDLDWFEFYTPPISSIRINFHELAEEAVRLLFRRMENIDIKINKPILRKINYELVVRKSTTHPKSEERIV